MNSNFLAKAEIPLPVTMVSSSDNSSWKFIWKWGTLTTFEYNWWSGKTVCIPECESQHPHRKHAMVPTLLILALKRQTEPWDSLARGQPTWQSQSGKRPCLRKQGRRCLNSDLYSWVHLTIWKKNVFITDKHNTIWKSGSYITEWILLKIKHSSVKFCPLTSIYICINVHLHANMHTHPLIHT